jgi:hypothetical protein
MIAYVSKSGSWPTAFLRLLPTIQRHVRFAFRHLRPANREEAVSEAVAAAFVAFCRLAERGKRHLIYPTPLARYAILHVKNDRRIGGHETSRDVLSAKAQARHGFRVVGLQQFDEDEKKWVELIAVEDRNATPAEVACVRLDFRTWLKRLPKTKRRIAKTLAEGESTNGTAAKHGVTAGRVSQIRRELEESWQEFQKAA